MSPSDDLLVTNTKPGATPDGTGAIILPGPAIPRLDANGAELAYRFGESQHMPSIALLGGVAVRVPRAYAPLLGEYLDRGWITVAEVQS